MDGIDDPRNGQLDSSLLDRVNAHFEELKRRFDEACSHPSDRNFTALRSATDDLMRASAAILLALGRAS
jgi:hypothetical protein